jgi:carbon storage regulator
MLVLTRRTDESIMIGNNVEVVILGVEGDVVKVGIRAPKEIDIYRHELYLAIQEENKAAVSQNISSSAIRKIFKK